jgi:membrane-associated phospholipid phosphatase
MTARTRLALGVLGTAATASVVRRDRVGPREVLAFRAVNELPDPWYRPLWVVMQAGALGAVPATAAVARAAGRPGLSGRLLLGGGSAWLLAKAVKHFVQRPRPVVLLPQTHCRGPEAVGLGYVSGHAAVVAALSSAALPALRGPVRGLVLVLGPVVGLARLYVGAHLPLDVVGGAALGLAADAAVSLAVDHRPGGPSPLVRDRRVAGGWSQEPAGRRAPGAAAGQGGTGPWPSSSCS